MMTKINAKINANKAWVNFCKIKSETGISNLDNIVSDWRMVDIPPKLIIKLQNIVAKVSEKLEEISIHPFVISMSPSRKILNFCGKNAKKTEKNSIIIKKTAIIVPTDIMLKLEFITISPISIDCFFDRFRWLFFIKPNNPLYIKDYSTFLQNNFCYLFEMFS